MTRKWTHIRRDIEVVITRRSWKPFVRKGAWVRIPLSPLGIRAADHYIDYQNQLSGEVPKRLKGHPWKGCRSLIAARGFKSLLLRFVLKKDEKSCWQSENNVRRYWTLPLRTATTWTLKMKDWTVFKTLKILIKKSPGWTSLNEKIQNKNKPNNSRTV